MFEIEIKKERVELYVRNSQKEYMRTGTKRGDFVSACSYDEWMEFLGELVALTEKMNPELEPEVEKREPELKGRADQIHDILKDLGPLPYQELGEMLDPPVDRKRITRLLSQMIRDGIGLVRFGSPRQVGLK